MTCLALAGKCNESSTPVAPRGCAAAVSAGAANNCGFSSDASAAVPMPALVRPKKCRRVNNKRCCCSRFIALVAVKMLVKVGRRIRHVVDNDRVLSELKNWLVVPDWHNYD